MENVITKEQKKAAYVALTDTLSLEQMQLLNTIMDVQEVCPSCRHTYPDSTELDSPMHPRYVAGYKAGHRAGRRRNPLPKKEDTTETPKVVVRHVFQAVCSCCNVVIEYEGKDIKTIELGMSRLSRRVAKGIHCTECNTFIEHKPVPYWLSPTPVRE